MTPQDAQALLQKYLDGDCTTEEKALLETWWTNLQEEFPWEIPAGQAEAIHHRLLSKIRSELEVRQLPWRRYATAAAAALVVSLGAWLWWPHHNTPPVADAGIYSLKAKPGGNHAVLTLAGGKQLILDSAANGMLTTQGGRQILKQNGQLDYQPGENSTTGEGPAAVFNTLSTPKGGQYKLILPDGTHVWLDAVSSITYPTAFTGKTREVSISGQAYFEVVHDPRMPFEVKVEGQTVRDIGTAFNINAYPDEPAVRITLAEGKAAVGTPTHEIVLKKPGEQAEYTQGQLRQTAGADLEAVLAWKNGLFYLTSADIATVMRQVARWYDIDIQFDNGIPSGHITGELPRNTNLSTVLKVLQTSGVHFSVQGRTLHLTP
jgi:ferric-dicitrate binding protein FerR (iron transport regulator)